MLFSIESSELKKIFKLSTDLASQPEDEIVYFESEQSFLSTQLDTIIIYMYFPEIV